VVRGFRTAVGTTSDGILGPITWRALVSGMQSG
jgi:peptidoglycan hydrolase-like protein with peptidoglycan-binding domain